MATATENALARFEEKVGSLESYVAEKLGYDPEDIEGYFSAEQVDALALTISNIENDAGFVIGDQTGIGKGRVVAGLFATRWTQARRLSSSQRNRLSMAT